MSYYNDHRVKAQHRWYKSINRRTMKATVVIYDYDEDCEYEKEVPFEFEKCLTCDGRGTHVNPSVDCDGLTGEDFYEDPDFMEDYFSGHYDVTCYGCGGNNVVPVCMDEETNEYLAEESAARAEMRAEYEAERRFGA